MKTLMLIGGILEALWCLSILLADKCFIFYPVRWLLGFINEGYWFLIQQIGRLIK